MIVLKSADEVKKMKAAGRVVFEALQAMRSAIVPDKSTTTDLEKAAITVLCKYGADSPFLGYAPHGHPPFPAWTCISVNDVVVHGVPGNRVLMSGDIVSCDVGARLSGYYADSAWTFPVGRVSESTSRLLRVTEEALYKGIEQTRIGRRLGDIGHAVSRHAKLHGYSIVKEMVGHGVGRKLHEDPQVPNYGKSGKGDLLQEGMTLAIEPMINQGRSEIHALDDEWTIVTTDGKLSAHFEHTVAITKNGPVILTKGD